MVTKKTKEVAEESKDTSAELLALLSKRLPSCFEREPAPAYTPELKKLADEIISLLK